jgi:hypothetical protein
VPVVLVTSLPRPPLPVVQQLLKSSPLLAAVPVVLETSNLLNSGSRSGFQLREP